MSPKKPGVGVRVSGGRLRVDAARAIDKLRSYQLADPTGWVLEVVRAGVGLSAVAVSVEGSASDVFVAIACEPPPDASLPRLFEELVDPSPDPGARPLRLLAIGLNAALGGATRFADVYAIDASGSRRVRFTPEVFATEGAGAHDVAPGMRSLAVVPAELPSFAPRPQRGLVVHVRSKIQLAVLSRWATGELPRELSLVNDAATEVSIPISVNGLPVPRDPTLLLREPLEEGGYVAIVTPRGASMRATLEAAELGVVLSREPWQLALADEDAPVPLVLRIDRARLPTNAARSAVRWDEPMLERALADGREALGRLVQKLAKAIDEEREPGRHSWLRLVGLMLLAAEVRGPSYREKLVARNVSALLRPLLDAALFVDATGRARSAESLRSSAWVNEVHFGSVFARAALAPWVGDVLAAPPGDPTHLLFGELPPPSAEDTLSSAEAALEVRERWLAQPVQPPVVSSREGGIVRVPLEIAAGEITPSPTVAVGGSKRVKSTAAKARVVEGVADLTGEVILGAGDAARVIELRLDGRTLERARSAAGVPIRGVAEHPRFVPTLSFDAVSDSPARRDVLAAVGRAVLAGQEAIARMLAGEAAAEGERSEWLVDPDVARVDPRLAALVREGLLGLTGVSSGAKDLVERLAASAIDRAPVWPTTDGSLVSLAALRREKVIGLVSAARRRDAILPTGRTVLVVSDAERVALTEALPRTHLVEYGRLGPSRLTASSIAASQLGECALGIVFDHGDYRGFAGWGVEASQLRLSHVGVSIGARDASEGVVPTRVRVDDDTLIPDDAWGRYETDRPGGGEGYAPARLSIEIARQVVRAWLGARPDTLLGSADLESEPVVRSVLREARNGLVEGDEASRLRLLPLFPVFGRTNLATLEEIVSRGAAIPYVPARAIPPQEERAVDVFALKLERVEAEGLAALFGLRASTTENTSLVKAALRKQTRDERLTRIRRGAEVDVSVPGAHPTVPMAGTGILAGVLGYAPHVRDGRIKVLVEGRPFAVLTGDAGLPPSIEGVVSVDESLLDDRVEALSETGRSRVRGAALSAARTLLPGVVRTRGSSLFIDSSVVLLASGLVDRKKRKGEPGLMIDALLALPTLSSVAGSVVSIAEAMGDGELLFTTEPIDWVGPLAGEEKDPLDGTIVHVPWSPEQPARILLDRLIDGAGRDVTVALRRLVTARRAARGLTPRPPLRSSHERALARTVEELAAKSAKRELILETLGIGAIVLSPNRPSSIVFYEGGSRVLEEQIDFVPAFEAAVESPLIGGGARALSQETRDQVKQAISALLAELLRALADARAFEGAPGWAIDAQRDAAVLGGKEHLDQLAEVPLFETTAGTRASPSALLAQAARFGVVWWTRDMTSTYLPLEPERIALRMSPGSASALARYVRLFDAQSDLALDQIARQNRDRSPVESIALTADELRAPLGAAAYTEGGREVAVVPLLPIRAGDARMSLHRERRLLEQRDVPGEIPAVVRVDSPRLVPNRLWDAVVRDQELQKIEKAVTETIEKAVLEKMPSVGSSATALTVDGELMESVPHPSGRVVRGTLWLGSLDPREGSGVRVIDADTESLEAAPAEPLVSTAPRRQPAVIPLEGTLVLWGALRETGANTLDAVGRHVYQRLLSRVAKRVANGNSPDADLDLAQLIRGAALGFLSKSATKEALGVLVPFGITDVGTVGDVAALFDRDLVEGEGGVIAIEPGEIERAKEQRALLALPVFVRDGSLASMHLQLALGERVRTMHDALAEALELDEPEPVETPVERAPAPVVARRKEAEPAPKRGKKKKAAETARAKSEPPAPAVQAPLPSKVRAGPIAPLAVALGATLKRLGSPLRAVVDPTRATPMLLVEDGELSLAGDDVGLRAIAGTTAGRDRASQLIAAHAFSVQTDAQAALRSLNELLE